MPKHDDCTCIPDEGYFCDPCESRKWDAFVEGFPEPPRPTRYLRGGLGDRCPECGHVDIHAPTCQQ